MTSQISLNFLPLKDKTRRENQASRRCIYFQMIFDGNLRQTNDLINVSVQVRFLVLTFGSIWHYTISNDKHDVC